MIETLNSDVRFGLALALVFTYLFVATVYNGLTDCRHELAINRIFLVLLVLLLALSPAAVLGTTAFFAAWFFFTAPYALTEKDQRLQGKAYYAAMLRQFISNF